MKIIKVERCKLGACPYCRDYTNGVVCANEFPRKEIRSKHFDEFDDFLFPCWCKLDGFLFPRWYKLDDEDEENEENED